MSGITLGQAKAQLADWMAANEKCADKQTYTLSSGRSLTYANADLILKQIEFWDAKCKQLDPAGRGSGGVAVGVPCS